MIITSQSSIKKKREEIMNRLDKIYEDDEIDVAIAPSLGEVKQIVLEILKEEGPMSVKELHVILSEMASDEKIRMVLEELVKEGKVKADSKEKKYFLIGVKNE